MRSTKTLLVPTLALSVCCTSLAAAELQTNDNKLFTLYGQLWLKLSDVSTATDDNTRLDFAESRIGVKGEQELEQGITGFYTLELGYNDSSGGNVALSQREALVGLRGDFGTATIGRFSSQYKMAGVKIDPFNDTAAGTGLGGPNFGLSMFTGGFFDNSLAYSSPDLGVEGLSAQAMVFIDDTTENSHDFNIGFSYETDAISVYAQYLSINDGNQDYSVVGDESALRLSGQIKIDNIIAALSIEALDEEDKTYLYLTSSYVLEKGKVSASIGSVEDTGDGVTVGYFHNISDDIMTYALYSDVDGDSDADDRRAISLGLNYYF